MTAWHDLRRPPPSAPALIHRVDLSAARWSGLCLDGAYVPVGWGAATRADLTVDAGLRAAVLARRVPARAVIGRQAAAWVHLGGPQPYRLDLLVPPRARRVDPLPDLLSHETTLARDDVVALGGTRVTGRLRTALDLARHAPPDVAADLVRALTGSDEAAQLRARLVRSGPARGLRQARAVLDRLTPAPPAPPPTAPR